MKLAEVDEKTIESLYRYGKLVDLQNEFLNSGRSVMEIIYDIHDYSNCRSMVNSIGYSIRKQGNNDKIKVFRKGTRVFLAKKD